MEKYYKKLLDMVREIEDIRIALFQSEEHRDEFLSTEDFLSFNEDLWKIQSDLRILVSCFVLD